MKNETFAKPYAFTFYPEGSVHARTEIFINPNGEQIRTREHTASFDILSGDYIDSAGIGRISGGGFARDLVIEEFGRSFIFTTLFPRINGGSKERVVEKIIKTNDGSKLYDMFPIIMIDAGNGIRLSLGEIKLGGAMPNDTRISIMGMRRAGVHNDAEKKLPCAEFHKGHTYAEVQFTIGKKDPQRAIAHIDFAHRDIKAPMNQLLFVTSRPDIDENKMRSLIDVTLILS